MSKLIELCDEFIESGNKFVGDVTFKDLYFLKEAPVLAKATKVMYEALNTIHCDFAGSTSVIAHAALHEVDKLMERGE